MKQVLILLAGVVVMAGCHPGTTIVTGADGKGSVTFTDDKGNKMTAGNGNVSEADLGLPSYPGASPVEGANSKVETPDGSNIMSTWSSSDDVQKVVDFYKDAITKAGYTVTATMVSGDNGSVGGQKGTDQNDVVSVVATKDKDKNATMIMVNHSMKKGGASPSAPATPS